MAWLPGNCALISGSAQGQNAQHQGRGYPMAAHSTGWRRTGTATAPE